MCKKHNSLFCIFVASPHTDRISQSLNKMQKKVIKEVLSGSFLNSYGPDLNAIGKSWAQAKSAVGDCFYIIATHYFKITHKTWLQAHKETTKSLFVLRALDDMINQWSHLTAVFDQTLLATETTKKQKNHWLVANQIPSGFIK